MREKVAEPQSAPTVLRVRRFAPHRSYFHQKASLANILGVPLEGFSSAWRETLSRLLETCSPLIKILPLRGTDGEGCLVAQVIECLGDEISREY